MNSANEIMIIIGQIMGFIAVIISFILYQQKTQKRILAVQTILCLTIAIHYFLIGAYPGMVLNIIGAVRCIIYYNKNIFKGKIWPIVLCSVMFVGGVLSWNSVWSILVIVGLVINTYCLSLKNPQHLRYSILITSPMVLLYDCVVFSLGGILMESFSIISAMIGIIRFRTKKNNHVCTGITERN